MASLAEVLGVFDSIEPAAEYPEQPGIVRCCGLPVVMRNGHRIECTRCKRTVEQVARQWMVSKWGTRGIKLGW